MGSVRMNDTIPKPGQHNGSRFAKAGRDVDELRAASGPASKPFSFRTTIPFSTCKATLVVVGQRFSGRRLKELLKNHLSPIPGYGLTFWTTPLLKA
jgi:hypothetical protein